MESLKHAVILGSLVGLTWAGSASAAVVNVDFNSGTGPTYSGTAAVSDTGTHWNGLNAGVASASLSNMTASDGSTATTVDVAFNSVPVGGTYSLGLPAGVNDLLRDYMFADSAHVDGARTVTLSGLTAGQSYDLYLYAGVNGQGTRFTVDGVSRSTTGSSSEASPWVEGASYALFSGLLPDAQNQIVITWADNTATATPRHLFNGLQLATVPEPAGLALTAGAGGLFLARRRRRPQQ